MKTFLLVYASFFLPISLMASIGRANECFPSQKAFISSSDLADLQSGEEGNMLLSSKTSFPPQATVQHNRKGKTAKKKWLAKVLERKIQKRLAKVAEKTKKQKRKVYPGNWNSLFKALLGYLLLPLILVSFIDPFNFWWDSIELAADGIDNSGSKTAYSGKGLAIAGLVLSVLGYVALFALAIILLLI